MGAVQPHLLFTEDDVRNLAKKPEVTETVSLLQPAHLPVLFPEVFLRTNPGFDVLLGNPPWEKLHVEEHQWWGLRLPGLRSKPSKQRTAMLEAFRAHRPDLEAEYRAERLKVRKMSDAVSSGPFPGLGAAHLDLYQAFAWRNWQLLRERGRCGLVLPRGAHSGSGLAQWRDSILKNGAFEDVVFLANNGGWIFETVHNSYTVGLTVVSKGDERVVRWAGPFVNEKDFRVGASELAEVPASEFRTWSRAAAFPLIPDPVSADVFRLMKLSPRFDDSRDGWEFRPLQGDLNSSSDKAVMDFNTQAPRTGTPILAGASFNLWNPDSGAPFAYGREEVLRPHLSKKLAGAVKNARSAYKGLSFKKGSLPMDSARIAFRDIARATDTRTVIACLIPPGSATVHQSPILVRRGGDERAEAFLLGVMASIPFDWGARRWVELHLTFELLNALPVPRYTSESRLTRRVADISGRLAAVDERYAEWAGALGLSVGSVKTPAEKDDLLSELDALVSLLYGLTEDQVAHIFATFHRGWKYQPRLEAVLEHYAEWKGQA